MEKKILKIEEVEEISKNVSPAIIDWLNDTLTTNAQKIIENGECGALVPINFVPEKVTEALENSDFRITFFESHAVISVVDKM